MLAICFRSVSDMTEYVFLLCKFGVDTLVIKVHYGFPYNNVIGLVCENWCQLNETNVRLSYSMKGHENCLLSSQDGLDLLCCLGFKRVDVMVSMSCLLKNLSHSSVLPSLSEESSCVVQGGSEAEDNDNHAGSRAGHDRNMVLLSSAWSTAITHVKQVFSGGAAEFRDALSKYSIEVGFLFDYKRNDPNLIVACCKRRVVDECQWYISAKKDFSGSFIVTEFVDQHSCDVLSGRDGNKRFTSKIVAGLIKQTLISRPSMRANEVVSTMRTYYGLETSYDKCWHGLKKAKETISGGSLDSYKELEAYTKATVSCNPGSHVVLDIDSETNSFRRVFIALAGCIEGFKYCRPMLFVDGTFLKGKYQGMLLSATGKNGNCGIFPLAYGVVDSENVDNWQWFLEHVRLVIGDRDLMTFLSDRHSGLLQSIPLVFPHAKHFFCVQHLIDNLKTKFSGSGFMTYKKERLTSLFRQCAKAASVELFDEYMLTLRSEGGAVIEDFLNGLPYDKWANAFVKTCRYGETTSNVAECFNSWILIPREMPITQMLDAIRVKMMKMMNDRRLESGEWMQFLCPKYEGYWSSFAYQCRTWQLKPASDFLFEVCSDPSHSVNFRDRTCTCGRWQVFGFPCVHAVLCMRRTRYTKENSIDHYFHAETYRKSYEFGINPIPTSLWSTPKNIKEATILPPTTKRQPGRPRKARFPSGGERSDAVLKKILCGRCEKYGHHNSRTCKEPIGPSATM